MVYANSHSNFNEMVSRWMGVSSLVVRYLDECLKHFVTPADTLPQDLPSGTCRAAQRFLRHVLDAIPSEMYQVAYPSSESLCFLSIAFPLVATDLPLDCITFGMVRTEAQRSLDCILAVEAGTVLQQPEEMVRATRTFFARLQKMGEEANLAMHAELQSPIGDFEA